MSYSPLQLFKKKKTKKKTYKHTDTDWNIQCLWTLQPLSVSVKIYCKVLCLFIIHLRSLHIKIQLHGNVLY